MRHHDGRQVPIKQPLQQNTQDKASRLSHSASPAATNRSCTQSAHLQLLGNKSGFGQRSQVAPLQRIVGSNELTVQDAVNGLLQWAATDWPIGPKPDRERFCQEFRLD